VKRWRSKGRGRRKTASRGRRLRGGGHQNAEELHFNIEHRHMRGGLCMRQKLLPPSGVRRITARNASRASLRIAAYRITVTWIKTAKPR